MKATSKEHFRDAERIFAEALGVNLTERLLEIRGPVRQARVIETGTGAPLLFVHGGGGSAAQWLPLMALLSDRRSIAVDRPGCGLTNGYDYTREPDLRAHAVAFLEGVLDALGLDQVDVAANSMGGLWSLWIALDRPQRVRSLTLLGFPALAVGTSAPLPMRLMSRRGIGALLERPQSAAGMARVMQTMGHEPTALEQSFPGLLALSQLAANLPGAGASFRSMLWRVLRLRGARPDCALDIDELRDLDLRPLLILGDRDPFGNKAAAERFVTATHGQVEFLQGGHLPWLDATASAAHLVMRSLESPETQLE